MARYFNGPMRKAGATPLARKAPRKIREQKGTMARAAGTAAKGAPRGTPPRGTASAAAKAAPQRTPPKVSFGAPGPRGFRLQTRNFSTRAKSPAAARPKTVEFADSEAGRRYDRKMRDAAAPEPPRNLGRRAMDFVEGTEIYKALAKKYGR